jgi:hypothetical protein
MNEARVTLAIVDGIAHLIRRDRERWARVAHASGIRAD